MQQAAHQQSSNGYNQQRPNHPNGHNPNNGQRPANQRPANNQNGASFNSEATKDKDFGIKFVAYGGKAAFQVSTSKTKDNRDTIGVESANKKNPNNPNDKSLDWENKCHFQLTLAELPVFIAVMYGFIPSARFDLHGACNSKFLEVINQKDKFFFKSGSQDIQMKVAPVSLTDATHFGMLALSSYRKNFPGLSSESVMNGVKVLVKRLVETNGIKIPK